MMVDKETAEKRMAICDSCEHLKEVLKMKTCSLCGCVMRIKTELKVAACPKGKW
jgi:hypothetical protein